VIRDGDDLIIEGGCCVRNPMIAIAAPLIVLVGAGAGPTAPRNDSICQRDLKADLDFLAGNAFRGRLTASPENEMARGFVASRFERLGLAQAGKSTSYSHPFNLATASLGPSNSIKLHGVTGEPLYASGQEYFTAPLCPPGRRTVTGNVAFAGFGVVAPAYGHDDYRNLDVKGKIVLVLSGEPGADDPKSPFDGVITSEFATPASKALIAQERGAIGILFTVAPVEPRTDFEGMARLVWPEKPPRIPLYMLEDRIDKIEIPAAVISTPLARLLLKNATKPLEALAEESQKPRPGPAGGEIRITLTTDVHRKITRESNVLAALEGGDPRLKDEWVVVSSHVDHMGVDGDEIMNGADDNGSGVVGVLEIAEAYALAARDGQRPGRSILFVVFNAEEQGLLGSWAFVERPPVPLDRIVAVLNMDMIGRNEEVPEGGGPRFNGLPAQTAESNANAVNLLGYSRSAALTQLIEKADAPIGLTLKLVLDDNKSQLLRRSDQWPFLQRGIPSAFFHTGLHPDYHTSRDIPGKINYPKMERIVRLVHQASWDLSRRSERPRLDAKTPAPGAH
jgi:Peptidase family M28/PA domain